MALNPIKLDSLRVASPCQVPWESMTGDDHVRFCSLCRLNVYNISGLTRSQAESLLANTEGRICGRFYRRADGTVITQDCPVGLKAIRRRVSKYAVAVLTLISGLSLPITGRERAQNRKDCTPQVKVIRKELKNQAGSIISGIVLDQNGAVIANANVGVTNRTSNKSSVRKTDDQGRFQFSAVAPGEYLIRIESPGFEVFQNKRLKIEPNQLVEINLVLRVDETTETVGILMADEDYAWSEETMRLKADTIQKLPLP